MKVTLGVSGYVGNYRNRRQSAVSGLYGRPLSDCCFFLSTPTSLIAGLMAGSNRMANLNICRSSHSVAAVCVCICASQ